MNTYCVKTFAPEGTLFETNFYSAPSIDLVVEETLKKMPSLIEDTTRTADVAILLSGRWGVRIEAIKPIQLTGEKS